MLVIKVYVTKRVPLREGESVEKGKTFHTELKLIDEIHIQNMKERGEGSWEYKIRKPRSVKARISHFRKAGYRPLLIAALGLLDLKNGGKK